MDESSIKSLIEILGRCNPTRILEKSEFSERGLISMLSYLKENSDRTVFAGDLARHLQVSTARIAILLKKMSGRGLIKKTSFRGDARKTVVKLTPNGAAFLKEADDRVYHNLRLIMEDVGVENFKKFVELASMIEKSAEKQLSNKKCARGQAHNDTAQAQNSNFTGEKFMYQLFTDTDTDLTPEKAAEYGYKMISMPYSVNGEDEIFPYVDFETFDYHAFYETLRGGVLPKTFALSPQKYIEYFEPYLKEGKDILYVHFSAAMSGTFDAMKLAWDELKEKYPERMLYTVDTKGITLGSYSIVCEIGQLAKNGATVQEILDWAKTEVDKFAVYFYADDLKFFARSGRVSNFSAGMGNLLGIRPILTMNSEGKMVSIAKAKGRKGAMNKLLEYVRELNEDMKAHKVTIGHSDAYDQALMVRDMLIAEYGEDLETEIVVVNPTAGSHCGPGTIGVGFHAKHR